MNQLRDNPVQFARKAGQAMARKYDEDYLALFAWPELLQNEGTNNEPFVERPELP